MVVMLTNLTIPRHRASNVPEMSRLMGGIGGRGPGEQELERDRRKVRRRIQYVKEELELFWANAWFLKIGRRQVMRINKTSAIRRAVFISVFLVWMIF